LGIKGTHFLFIFYFYRLGTVHNARILQQRRNDQKPLSAFQHGLAGLAGGLTVSFVATPVEQIKARLQVQYDSATKLYSGPVDCVRQVVRNNGIQGLWTGLLPTMLFRSWFFVFWGSYDVSNENKKKRHV
jgi:solute carrier family 25 carnitine/acylcarnitine transporter 20/29